MTIRRVDLTDDFDAIANIYAASWKVAYKNIVPQQYLDELTYEYWSPKLRNSNYESFVLLEIGEYVGTSSICAARDEEMNGWGEIVSIYLLPEYFNKGLGKPLLDKSMSELLNKGYENIYLWVLEENDRARRFYEKNGFVLSDDSAVINIADKDLVELRYIYETDK